jgi:DNA-binding XRE family transcriptional regulator
MDVGEFADFVGTSERTIYYYEQGRCMPQLYTAMLIAEKLGTSLDDLVRGD